MSEFNESTNIFGESIFAVLKQLHPLIYIDGSTLLEVQCIILQILHRIIQEYSTSENIDIAMSKILSGELSKHAKSEGVKAISRYTSSYNAPKETRAKKADLQFSILVFETILSDIAGPSFCFSDKFVIYLAAVCEYLIAEILELSGNMGRRYISSTQIKQALNRDEELQATIDTIGYVLGESNFYEKVSVSKCGLYIGETEIDAEFQHDPSIRLREINSDTIRLSVFRKRFEAETQEFSEIIEDADDEQDDEMEEDEEIDKEMHEEDGVFYFTKTGLDDYVETKIQEYIRDNNISVQTKRKQRKN